MENRFFEPHDPKPGQLVFQNDTWMIDVRKAPDRVGKILDVVEPIQGNLIQYKLRILLLDGTTILSPSKEWKCMRRLATFSQQLAASHQSLIQQLEKLTQTPKKKGVDSPQGHSL